MSTAVKIFPHYTYGDYCQWEGAREKLSPANSLKDIVPALDCCHLKQIIQYYGLNPDEMERELHLHAKKLLDHGKVREAWQVLLTAY